MIKQFKFISAICFAAACGSASAEDISGVWQQIDDKTGAAKAIIEIKKESNNTFTGTIVKVTPRPGYTPRETCYKCPAPYTNQPILGMEILKGLQHVSGTDNYEKGRIMDPLSGKLYDAKMRLNASGKRLTLRAYMGVSTLGRNQTWIRRD
ncbi:DUF2147 domain-containing protein [Acinetobacter chinensis]|uniref:DUF2147 domain-containing protein n=1 Tax=Acinetobacter chinensis TaxID=2004650 RepID=A0A3B7LV51_9GAMM|nr:DUF2147 domain-containing protein [Acinetobacter chinensis]AXY55855.1 DUF2147 domain-containing protein [Acinetobacter chinensis]